MFLCSPARDISGLERKHNILGTTAGGTRQSSWVLLGSYKSHFSGFGKGEISATLAPKLAAQCLSPAAASPAGDTEEWVAGGSRGWMWAALGTGDMAQLGSAAGLWQGWEHPEGCSWLTQAIRSGVWLIQQEAEQSMWEHVCVKIQTLTEAGVGALALRVWNPLML